ncbi:response regulator [Sulfurimonas sp.]|uniref:response regulator n=1 Tax=Sulfurimonas sp. TaxID=2022749 RepID=UPI0035699DE0
MNINLEDIKQFKQMCLNISILMVDDEVELTKYYKEIAQRFFESVDIANSGAEALEMFKQNKYDIIYTDLNMPGMHGIELIKKIKEINPKQKFIVISASNESDKLMDLLSLNISGFIVKPFTINNFMHVSMEQISIVLQAKQLQEQANELNKEIVKITKEKQDQEQMLIQQSKLAQTGEMISMISHQWRQPLSSITTTLSGLKTRLDLGIYDDEENPILSITSDFNKAFDKIENMAIFLSKTVNDFRNFYRPDNKKTIIDICDAMDSVLRILNPNGNNIKVDYKCAEVDNREVYTFEGELKQVFISIINNAVDALLDKGTDEAKISIHITQDADNIIVSIADNAGGIPDDIINNIFLPYFSTKNEKNGTGLGLHMAKTIIEHHVNGSLSVNNSKAYNGAEFIISIPKSKKKD